LERCSVAPKSSWESQRSPRGRIRYPSSIGDSHPMLMGSTIRRSWDGPDDRGFVRRCRLTRRQRRPGLESAVDRDRSRPGSKGLRRRSIRHTFHPGCSRYRKQPGNSRKWSRSNWDCCRPRRKLQSGDHSAAARRCPWAQVRVHPMWCSRRYQVDCGKGSQQWLRTTSGHRHLRRWWKAVRENLAKWCPENWLARSMARRREPERNRHWGPFR
jgi:hypothetical protein